MKPTLIIVCLLLPHLLQLHKTTHNNSSDDNSDGNNNNDYDNNNNINSNIAWAARLLLPDLLQVQYMNNSE